MRIITEPKELIGNYVAQKQNRSADWGLHVSFGLVDSNDKLVGGIVFNGFVYPNILMNISAERLTPNFIAVIMQYAFVQLKCKRITGVISIHNKKSRTFAKKLGFKLEGIMKDADVTGDLCIYGLLERDAHKWLNRRLENV